VRPKEPGEHADRIARPEPPHSSSEDG
jgi:hypothetical protein